MQKKKRLSLLILTKLGDEMKRRDAPPQLRDRSMKFRILRGWLRTRKATGLYPGNEHRKDLIGAAHVGTELLKQEVDPALIKAGELIREESLDALRRNEPDDELVDAVEGYLQRRFRWQFWKRGE